MLKVRVRRLSAVLFTATSLVAGGVNAVGCVADAVDEATSPQEVDFGSASSAYSVDNPGSAVLNLSGTYADYQYECTLSDSTTDEFVRTGELLQIRIPASQIWQSLHPDQWEEPAMERVQQTRATITVSYFQNGQPVGSTTVTTAEWSGEAYWVLYATTTAFVVPAGADQIRLAVAFADAGDAAAQAAIDASVMRPVAVFGGDLPDKSVLFDSDGPNLRNRVLEGGAPVAGAAAKLAYTEYRADTLVDASKINRQIGKMKSSGRFGEQIVAVYGEVVHEVSAGVYFDDIQGWRPEVAMTPNKASAFAPQNWRTVFESLAAVPSNATKMQVYYHVKTYLVVDYTRYGAVTEQWYQQGQRVLVAERWDNPEGGGSNFDLGVGQPETNPNLERTVVFVHAETQLGQDMFVRGGIDHAAAAARGISCTNADSSPNYQCAIPIVHRNLKNPTTVPWKTGDQLLDWYGRETAQLGTSPGGILAQGSAADWTTNSWPTEYGTLKTVATDGYGVEELNTYGAHYWMLDVDMDCSRALAAADGTRWFEVKAYISNGPGWEPDIAQPATPYASHNHFAQCGMVNVFDWGQGTATFQELP
jgi:hypothetical protein